MSSFAKNGNRVLFIENTGVRPPGIRDIPRIKNRIKNWFKGVKGIRKEMENLYIFSPIVLPFPYSRLARWINRHFIFSVLEKWMKVMDFGNPIVWTFLPTPLSIEIIDNIVEKLVVYYCIDNFEASSHYAKKVRKSEKKLLGKTDLVFVTSEELYKKCVSYNKKVYKFPFGVNMKRFEKDRVWAIPDDMKNIPRPIIGFSGGFRQWIDIDLLEFLVRSEPEYSFVFVGPAQIGVERFSLFKNVYFLGQKRHEELPYYIKNFDVAIIPYIVNEFTRCIFPAKLYEYLAMGKPIVATDLPEIELMKNIEDEIIYTAYNREDFRKKIKLALDNNDNKKIEIRIEIAKKNNWEDKIEEMSILIENEIIKKEIDKNAKWKEDFISFYKMARRRFLKVIAGFLLIYLILFKTPFIWLVAEPLKISQTPQKVDAIVVFGGGVGETGSPGKSTIERARFASELYQKGYANKIIFSSGYTYTTNDAENMKLIALSMGVRQDDIVIEQKANSAYENVVYCNEILKKNGWDEVVLVSSPYNMRRVWLVVRKNMPGVKVIYVPVENSQFYDRLQGRRLEQIRAIMHEYLGILYYWWKGWV